jgi:hypothetical protein
MSPTDQSRAESIRQRLRNHLRERGEDVQFGLQRYAVERFLYRLGASPYRDRFVLARQFRFDGVRLAGSIAATFERRRTVIEAALPVALTKLFYAGEARAEQWRAYLTRNSLPGAPADSAAVGELLRAFLGPVWSGLVAEVAPDSVWPPGGPWQTRSLSAAEERATAETTPDRARAALRAFRPYPVYQDSGVEWLGRVRAH